MLKIDYMLKIMCRAGFHCATMTLNYTDAGHGDGAIVRRLEDVESRLQVIVPQTEGQAMIVGRGDLYELLHKLVLRIKRGTIYKIPIARYAGRNNGWRILEFDKLYLYLNDGVKKQDYPILSEKMVLYGDGEVEEDGEEVGSIEDCGEYGDAGINVAEGLERGEG